MVSIVARGVNSEIAPRSAHLNLSGQDVLFIVVLIRGLISCICCAPSHMSDCSWGPPRLH